MILITIESDYTIGIADFLEAPPWALKRGVGVIVWAGIAGITLPGVPQGIRRPLPRAKADQKER